MTGFPQDLDDIDGSKPRRFEIWHDFDIDERMFLLVETEDGGFEILDPSDAHRPMGRFGHVDEAYCGLEDEELDPCEGRWYPRIDALPRRPAVTTLGAGAETAFIEIWVKGGQVYPRIAIVHATTDGMVEILDPGGTACGPVHGVDITVFDLSSAYALASRAIGAEGFRLLPGPWTPHPKSRMFAAHDKPGVHRAGVPGGPAIALAFDHDRWRVEVRLDPAFGTALGEVIERYCTVQGLDGLVPSPVAPWFGLDCLKDPHGMAKLVEAVMGVFEKPTEVAQCVELAKFLDSAALLEAPVRVG